MLQKDTLNAFFNTCLPCKTVKALLLGSEDSMPLLEGVHEGWHRLDTPTKNACLSLLVQTLYAAARGCPGRAIKVLRPTHSLLHANAGPECCCSRVSVKGAIIAVLLSNTAAPGCTTESSRAPVAAT